MLIGEKGLQHWIDHFYGYGSWEAKFWFVSHEEGGGDLPEEVAEKLDYFSNVHARSTQPTLCDIRALYRHVGARLEGPRADRFTSLFDYRFGNNAVLHGLWKNLIALVHGYSSEVLPDLLTYQKNSFAQPSACKETLIPLYPLPSSNHHAWYYSWLDLPQFRFLKSRSLYEEHVYATRMELLLKNIMSYKPIVVLMYGMNNINVLKESVQVFFPAAKFKMVKAIKQQMPQYHYADINGTKLLITTQIPALRHNRIETGFDWYSFGKSLRDNVA